MLACHCALGQLRLLMARLPPDAAGRTRPKGDAHRRVLDMSAICSQAASRCRQHGRSGNADNFGTPIDSDIWQSWTCKRVRSLVRIARLNIANSRAWTKSAAPLRIAPDLAELSRGLPAGWRPCSTPPDERLENYALPWQSRLQRREIDLRLQTGQSSTVRCRRRLVTDPRARIAATRE